MKSSTTQARKAAILPLFFCCQLATLGLLRQAPDYSLEGEIIAGYPIAALWIARILSVLVLCLIFMLVLRGKQPLENRPLLATNAVALLAGLGLSLFGADFFVLYCVGQCLIGISHAWILACWARYLTLLDRATRNRAISVAALLAMFIFTIMSVIPPTWQAGAFLVIAIGSVVPLLMVDSLSQANTPGGATDAIQREVRAREPQKTTRWVRLSGVYARSGLSAIPWELILLMACYALLFRILVFFDFPVDDNILLAVVFAIVRIGGMTLLFVYLSRKQFVPNTQQLIVPLFFLTLIGLLLLSGQNTVISVISVALMKSSWTFFYVLIWLLLPELANENRADPFITLLGGWIALNALLLIAAPLAYLFEVQVNQGTLSLTGLVIIVVYALTVALLLYRSSTKRKYNNGGSESASDEVLERGLDEHYAKLAASHNLTRRETDVFRLLVQGYSMPAIEREFVLSHSTVKTHARHIYEKFGVSGKQELIEYSKRPNQR